MQAGSGVEAGPGRAAVLVGSRARSTPVSARRLLSGLPRGRLVRAAAGRHIHSGKGLSCGSDTTAFERR